MLKKKLHLYKVLGIILKFIKRYRYCHLCFSTSRDRSRINQVGSNLLSVFIKRPSYIIIRKVFKIVFIEYLKKPLPDIDRFHINMLINFLHLIILRFRFQITKHNTIHHKLTVIRSITEIPSIRQISLTGLFIIIIHRLVHPIPDSTATEKVCRLYRLPIIHQVTTSVPHRMSIFGNMERIFDIIITFHRTTRPTDRRILVRTHIHYIIITFILDGTGFIHQLQRIISSHKVFPRSSFIAQRPDHDRRIVDIGMNHLHHTCDMRLFPFYRMRKRGSAVIIFMRLYIGFVFQIKTIFIA